MIGTSLDKYEVLSKIGEGGMATVYRGRHGTLKRQVAIKVLHPHLSASTRNRTRFAREARAIEHLRHPHILEIFDYSGVDQDDCYIITELVDGETLTELMHRCRRLPSEVVTLVGIALSEALDYAHASGILHRDLKPDNVMLRRDGCVKLMDFGIARFLDESQVTMTGALVGSPAFMSPEQAREEPLDARSDLFSLGTLLFFLLTGHLPFSGSNPSLILKNIIEGNRPQVVELAPTVSPALADVIERLLAPARQDRFDDAAQVQHALQAALDEVGIDPAETRWSLARLMTDPEALEHELEVYLGLQLIERGRDRIAAGDHLGGLRLVNRLLTLEPDHAEGLELLQRFHGVDERDSRRRWAVWAASAVLVLVFGAVVGVGLLGRDADLPPARGTHPTPFASVASVERPASPVAVAMSAPRALEGPAPRPTPEPSAGNAGATEEATAELVTDPPSEPAVAPPAPRAARPRLAAATETLETAPDASSVAAPAVDPTTPACVEIRTPDAPTEVYLAGRMVFQSRQSGCFELAAGTHELEIRGIGTFPRTLELSVAPGERVERVERVELRPAVVHFPSDYADACEVSLDGAVVGTVGGLERRLPIADVRSPHEVAVRCGGRHHAHTYPQVRQPDLTFPSPGDL